MHIFTIQPIHTIMLCKLINSLIEISSLGLMIIHEQFNLNHSTNTYFHKNIYFLNTIPGIVKPSFTIPGKSQTSVHLVNPQPTAIPGPKHMKQVFNVQINTHHNQTAPNIHGAVTAAPFSLQKFYQFGPKFWDRSYGPFPAFFISIHDLK